MHRPPDAPRRTPRLDAPPRAGYLPGSNLRIVRGDRFSGPTDGHHPRRLTPLGREPTRRPPAARRPAGSRRPPLRPGSVPLPAPRKRGPRPRTVHHLLVRAGRTTAVRPPRVLDPESPRIQAARRRDAAGSGRRAGDRLAPVR